MSATTNQSVFPAIQPAGRSRGLIRPIIHALRMAAVWHQRAKERHDLMAMDSRLLKDIGLSRADAWRVSNKPFWQP